MNNTLIVHVGCYKTGTSALQSALLAMHDELANRSVCYPNLTGEGFGWQAERGVASGNGAVSLTKDAAVDDATWRHLLDKCTESEVGSTDLQIVSSELLVGFAVEEFFWRSLGAHCEEVGREAEVVLYLRDPFSFVLSTYSQAVKTHGYCDTFEGWVDAHHTGRHFDYFLPYLYLDKMVEFARQYGCRLKVFRYEDAGKRIVEHFLESACGVSVGDLAIPNGELNLSLTAFDCSFHRGMNSRSSRLGKLLGWERTDTAKRDSQLSSGEPGRFELSSAGEAKLTALFEAYRSMLERCTDFADRVDYSIDRRRVTEHYTAEEAAIHLKFFELGQIMASSYLSGYIRWDLDQSREKTS